MGEHRVMERVQWLYRASQVLGLAGVFATLAAPSYAVVDLGADVRFSLGQVLILFAVGAAWGDMRGKVQALRSEVDRLTKKALEHHKEE